MCCFSGGSKEKLVKRILMHEKPTTSEVPFTEKLNHYLTPTLTLNHGEKPTTITAAYYKETFN